MDNDDLTPQQRAALITKWLLQHGYITEQQIVDGLGVSERVARHTLVQLSIVLPIYDHNQVWRVLEEMS